MAQAEAIVTPHLSALRKCTLATPMVVYEVKIASGGTTARAAISFNAKTEQLGAGTDCLAAAAKTIRLPTITPPGPTGATTTPTRLPVHRSGVILPGGIRPVEIVFKVISL
ncbi:MAG: hypothetical protein IPL79_01120 [Myxococcales bacterium]|nr:hypothetical protein [Myxococcales bacterium]